LEGELTTWHRAIYEKIIQDFLQKLSQNNQTIQEENNLKKDPEAEMSLNPREAIHHDDEDEDLQNEKMNKAVGIFEVEPNMEFFQNSDSISRRSDQSAQLFNVNMNTVIDELKDLLPQKKKPYQMKFFKQDRSGMFKEEQQEKASTAIQKESFTPQNNQNPNDRLQEYKFEQQLMPSDFRFDLANELRNRKLTKKNKELEEKSES